MRDSETASNRYYERLQGAFATRSYMRYVMDRYSRRQARRMVLAGEILPKDRVVDVGAGLGGFLLELARHMSDESCLVGVELSPDMRRTALARLASAGLTNLDVLAGSALDLRKMVDVATVVASCGMIKHLTDNQLADFFRQVHEILVPGGKLFVSEIRAPRRLVGLANRVFEAERLRGDAEVMDLLQACGFHRLRTNSYATTWMPMGMVSIAALKPE